MPMKASTLQGLHFNSHKEINRIKNTLIYSIIIVALAQLSNDCLAKTQQSISYNKYKQPILRLDNFNKELFWEEPDEGEYFTLGFICFKYERIKQLV